MFDNDDDIKDTNQSIFFLLYFPRLIIIGVHIKKNEWYECILLSNDEWMNHNNKKRLYHVSQRASTNKDEKND